MTMLDMSADLEVPSQADPVARGASTLIGGPLGRHAQMGGRRFFTPLMVLLLMTFTTFALGFAQKAPCRDPGRWGKDNYYAYTRLCYSDVMALYYSEGLVDHKRPYLDKKVEYPVLIGGAMYAADWLANLFAPEKKTTTVAGDTPSRVIVTKPPNPTGFYDVTAFLLCLAALGVTATTVVAAGKRRQWDAALVALAPGLILHATTNWDLLAVAIAGVGVAAWAKRRPGLAGVFFGLGVATKLYPLLFFLPLFFLCWRSRRLREWATCLLAAAGSWLAVNLYFILATQSAWAEFFVLNRKRPADWDSIYLAAQYVRDHLGQHSVLRKLIPDFNDVGLLNLWVGVLITLFLAALCVLILRAPQRPRLGQVLFLTLAGFLLLNKVNSPQYTLWLIPLAVLARPRWGAFLLWQGLEVLVFFTRFYFFICNSNGGDGSCGKGIHEPWFLVAVLLRNAALILLMAFVVREVLHPELDVVRASGEDDPAGGVLNDELQPAYA